jgi:hypothetical protein
MVAFGCVSLALAGGCPSGTEADQAAASGGATSTAKGGTGGGGAIGAGAGGSTIQAGQGGTTIAKAGGGGNTTAGQGGAKTGGSIELVTCASTPTESCMVAQLGQCQAHVGSLDNFESLCKQMNGVFNNGPCPTDGVIGGCALVSVLFSYYAPLTKTGVEQICAGKGTFCDRGGGGGGTTGGADAGTQPTPGKLIYKCGDNGSTCYCSTLANPNYTSNTCGAYKCCYNHGSDLAGYMCQCSNDQEDCDIAKAIKSPLLAGCPPP